MTWLSFCARRPGPSWKVGYGTGDRTLDEIEGVVDHSEEGSQAGAYSVLDGPEQSSWTFSLPKVGEPIQHYPLEQITWHAGLPGDRRHDTSLIGNLTLVGKEHEGSAGEPWTANQLHWSAKIDVAVRALCPAFGANPPTLRKNMWEHRWLSATSCPSGRNPWNAKFALINEWENPIEEGDMAKLIQRGGTGPVFVTDGVWKWGIPSSAVLQDLQRAGLVSGNIISLSGATFDRLHQTHGVALGEGATPDEIVDRFKERL
ncbi:hypothetical protein LCGC14_0921080 [marine sediment metagenome]|uniref:N-acetylmuramoyl-L-alanine amidase domain-containing protein n=1 Tax=marine sediment metagenome TaxID=412755 RepID=A0A0F9NVN5_9ZZZZ